MIRTLKAPLLIALALVSQSTLVQADPITYTISGTAKSVTSGSATFAGQAFTGDFTITAVADTNDVQGNYAVANADYVIAQSATLTINGTTYTITNSVAVGASGASGGSVAFANSDADSSDPNNISNDDVFGDQNAAFSNYDLKSSIGPEGGYGFVNTNNTDSYLTTTSGRFVLTAASSNGDVSFSAVAVPEPTSLVMLGLGIGAVGIAARRRRIKLSA